MTPHGRRVFLAVLIVVGALAAPIVADTAFADRMSQDSYVSRIWKSMLKGTQVDSAIQDCGFMSLEGNAPDWIEEICEKGLLEGAIINQDFTLINISGGISLEDLTSRLKNSFQARGWIEYESGHEQLSTYIKEEGACRWMMAEFAQTGGEANVVLHIKHA